MKSTPLIAAVLADDAAADPPKVTVGNLRRIFHNAFTDLIRFKEHLHLTFRICPAGHDLNSTAWAIILRSMDEGATWDPVHRFSVPQRDTRDPHFLIFNHRLLVYSHSQHTFPDKSSREQHIL